MPSSLAILGRAYPDPRERARAIGVWSSLTAIAGASGPLLGGALIEAFGWRSIFLINVPIGIVGVVLAGRFVRGGTSGSPVSGLDLPAQVAGATGLALLTWAVIDRATLGTFQVAAVVGCAAIALAGFVHLERRSARPMLPLRLFRDRTFASTAAAALLYAAAFFGALFVLSIDFQEVRGEAPGLAGIHLGTVAVSFGCTGVFGGRLAARYGTRSPMLAGLLALTVAAFALVLLPPSAPFAIEGPALALTGAGAALVAPSMNAAILASAPPSFAAVAGGVLNASRQIGTALGVAAFASSFHSRTPAQAVRISLCGAALLYVCALALAALAPSLQQGTAQEGVVLDH
jgi:DHA2 family methylenomycin A resistance protein-like MFS transporter